MLRRNYNEMKEKLPERLECNLRRHVLTVDYPNPFVSLTMSYEKFDEACAYIGPQLNDPSSPGQQEMKKILQETGLELKDFFPLFLGLRDMASGTPLKFVKELLPACEYLFFAVNVDKRNALSPPQTPAVAAPSPVAGLGILRDLASPASNGTVKIESLADMNNFNNSGVNAKLETLFSQINKNKHGNSSTWREVDDAFKRGQETHQKMKTIVESLHDASAPEITGRLEEVLEKMAPYYMGSAISQADQRFLLDDLRPELARLAALTKSDPCTYRCYLAKLELIVNAAHTDSSVRQDDVSLREWYLEWSIFNQFKSEKFTSGTYLQVLGRYHDLWPTSKDKLFAYSHKSIHAPATMTDASHVKTELSRAEKDKIHNHADKTAEKYARDAVKESEQKIKAELLADREAAKKDREAAKADREEVAKLKQELTELKQDMSAKVANV